MKKKEREQLEFQERLAFLAIYTEFDKWLYSIGFEPCMSLRSTPEDFHYSEYNEYIDSLYAVEHYVHNVLKLSTRFLRDRNEHKFMIVGEIGNHSEVMNIKEFKKHIFDWVVNIRDGRLNELEQLKTIKL